MDKKCPPLKCILSILTGCLLLTLSLPLSADAQKRSFITANDIDADIVPRLAHKNVSFAITTREKTVDLLLTDDSVLIQFSDQFLQNIADKIEEEEFGDDSHFINVIKSMVSTGVRTALDRALAIPLKDLKEISYTDGRLLILSHDSVEIFEDVEIDGVYVMKDFRPRDARRFAANAESKMI